jgi:hydroxymethylglutaryl-CoA synthase
MAVGIAGYGVYIPKYRIQREDIAKAWGGRGRGENAVPNENEDAITMAVEASFNAIEHAGLDDIKTLDAIYFGTDSALDIEHSYMGVIAETLGTRPDIDILDFTSSPRASVAAIKACMDAVEAGRIKYGLVIGSDFRTSSSGSNLELTFGAGAGALVLSSVNTIANIIDTYTYSTNFRDRWRSVGDSYVRDYEPRFTREYGYSRHIINSVKGLMAKSDLTIDKIGHIVFQQPDERFVRTVAKKLNVTPEQIELGLLFQHTGDTGAGSIFLGLSAILDRARPDDRILAVSYGSGVSDALLLIVNSHIETKRDNCKPLDSYLASKSYIDYNRYMKITGKLKKAENPARMGISPLSPMLWRAGAEMYRLIGAKCIECGYVNFPPSERKICIRCGGLEFKEGLLSRKGRIHTYCINYYMPAGFESPLPIIIADLDDGVRHRALGTEMTPDEINIDMPVELVLRNIASEENVKQYGNVFRPVRF